MIVPRQLEVEGEKLVTHHILEQTRRNGDDLAAIKTRLGRVEAKLGGVDLHALVQKVDDLDRKVDALTKSLPGIVADALTAMKTGRPACQWRTRASWKPCGLRCAAAASPKPPNTAACSN